jgi:hypothetical protein
LGYFPNATIYAYDALGHMVTQDGATLVYNGDGVLVQAGSTFYTQDLVAPLAQVLSDGSSTYLYLQFREPRLTIAIFHPSAPPPSGRSRPPGATPKANWRWKARGSGRENAAKNCCCWRPWPMPFCCRCLLRPWRISASGYCAIGAIARASGAGIRQLRSIGYVPR